MRPIPWGSNEWEWRKVLAEGSAIGRHARNNLTNEAQFDVRIVFRMNSLNIGRVDLDNLANTATSKSREAHPS
jgi:hypothetical protein